MVDEFIVAGTDIIQSWPDEVIAQLYLVSAVHFQKKPVWVMARHLPEDALSRLQSLRVDGVLVDDPELH